MSDVTRWPQFASGQRLSAKTWIDSDWTIGQAASLACCLEAWAPKAGNVHPTASFHDMDYADFLVSGIGIGPAMDSAAECGLGEVVMASITATRSRLAVNTNLGMVLLLAPLAKALAGWRASHQPPGTNASTTSTTFKGMRPTASELQSLVALELENLTERDTAQVYDAIRMAKPGGLGKSDQHDIHAPPPSSLREAMAYAAPIDAVARQYTNGFEEIFHVIVQWLVRGRNRGLELPALVCEVQLRWLAREPDGLIVRKAGAGVAAEAQQLADLALVEWLETGHFGVRWLALDSFLRADGHRRNPGTTADLIAASLFVILTTQFPNQSTGSNGISE